MSCDEEQDQDVCRPKSDVCRPGKEYVFVVEDEADLRESLVELIEDMGYDVIGCATPSEFAERSADVQTSCVILDIRLKGGDGISVLERLSGGESSLACVVLSGLLEPAVAAECIKLGALDYLVKPANEITLRRAIDRAIARSRSNYCLAQSKRQIAHLFEKLTPAELTIAGLLARGYPTKLIAGKLGRSENTVKIHRHRIMAKLMVNSVASVANLFNHLRED